MPTDPFDPAFRATVCIACGANVVGGAEDAEARCAACGASLAWPARPAGRPAPNPSPFDESLTAEASASLALPPSLARLWEGERAIPAHRAPEAATVWAELRSRVRAGEREAERPFVVLTRERMIRATSDGDPATARAIGEAAFDDVQTPFSRACLLGALVRAAVRAGSLDAASGFLAHFDAEPDSLAADTERRLAAALLASARAAPHEVLAWLGANETDVRTDVVSTWFASLLRAHALEALGRRGEAEAELRALLARRAGALEAIDHNLPRFPFLGEPASWYAVRRDTLEATRPTGELESEGRVVFAIGALLLLGVLLFATYDRRSIDWMLFAAAWAGTLPILGFGLHLVRLGRAQHRAFVRGRPRVARIVSATPGFYGRGGHTKLTRVELTIDAPSGEATTVCAHRFVPQRQRPRWTEGRTVVVFVAPDVVGRGEITTPPP